MYFGFHSLWVKYSFIFILTSFIVYLIISCNIGTNIMKIYKANIIIAIFQIRKLRRLRDESRLGAVAHVVEQGPEAELVSLCVTLAPPGPCLCDVVATLSSAPPECAPEVTRAHGIRCSLSLEGSFYLIVI